MRAALSKKSQEKEDKITKLYEANNCWDDWKFQLHWNKLEWVNPISQTKRNKTFQFLQFLNLNKVDRTSHWVGH